MNAENQTIGDGSAPLRTTLLELVQALTDQGLAPDEVVQIARESIDAGRIVLIGNFRGGLGAAVQVRAAFRAPTRRRKEPTTNHSGPT